MHDIHSLVRRGGIATLALMAAGAAQAHPGHDTHSLLDGFTHPFAGFDHLLAMVAVGVWSAAALPAGRRWLGPAVFLALLLAGGWLPRLGWVLPGLEIGVALGVVALGVLMVARLAVPVGLGLIGIVALMHGMAHGVEVTAGQSFAGYAAGFVAASALLHGAGLSAGGWLQRSRAWVWRATAAVVGASGLAMLAVRL